MQGKVVLVTGAAQGVGRQIALDIARAGAAGLILCDLQQDKGEAVASRNRRSWRRGRSSSPPILRRLARRGQIVAQAMARFGRIDSLVNAAGVTDRASVADGDAGALGAGLRHQCARARPS